MTDQNSDSAVRWGWVGLGVSGRTKKYIDTFPKGISAKVNITNVTFVEAMIGGMSIDLLIGLLKRIIVC